MSIIVLLSTYNGERYLVEQIESLLAQQDVTCRILVRDDGSKDKTTEILDVYQKEGKLTWYTMGNKGVAGSFWDLVLNAPESDYYAFCDQDDIWLPNKLERSIAAIADMNVPALFSSNLKLVDATAENFIGMMESDHVHTFGETFIRNIRPGCTMVFNHLLIEELRRFTPTFYSLHDSWIRRVCFAIGGCVIDDSEPLMLYRQHGHNVVGGRLSFKKKMASHLSTWTKHKNDRFNIFKELYRGYKDEMNEEAREMVEKAINYQRSLKDKLSFAFDSRIYSGKASYKWKFAISVLLNKY